MLNPEKIEVILSKKYLHWLLKLLTRQREDGTCALQMIFRTYCKESLQLRVKLKYLLFYLIIDAMRSRAGTSKQFLKEAVLGQGPVARALINATRSVGVYGLLKPQRFFSPVLVVWNYTQACNLHCKHCYQDARKALPNELTLEEQYCLVDQLEKMDVAMLALAGGEPLMGRHFWEIVKYAGSKEFHLSVATNGTLLTDRNVQRLADAGVDYLEISLDSVDPRKHDHFRGAGSWERTVQGIRNAIANGKIDVGIAPTITKNNFNEIRELADFAIELGANKLCFFNFIPAGRGRSMLEHDLTPEMREEMLKVIQEYLESEKIDVYSTAPQLGRACAMYGNEEGYMATGHAGAARGREARVFAKYIGGCGAGIAYCSVQPDGVVTPCVFMPLPIGNMREQELIDI